MVGRDFSLEANTQRSGKDFQCLAGHRGDSGGWKWLEVVSPGQVSAFGFVRVCSILFDSVRFCTVLNGGWRRADGRGFEGCGRVSWVVLSLLHREQD